VLEGELLDVGAGGGDVGEDLAQGARFVRYDDGDDRVPGGDATVLARDPFAAEIAVGDGMGDVAAGADGIGVRRLVGDRVQGREHAVEVAADLGEDGGDGSCVGREDLRPQRGVAGGDPGDVAQSLPGERDGGVRRVPQPRRHEAGRHLGQVRHQRDGLVVLGRRHDYGHRAERQRELADRGERGGVDVRRGTQHPRPAEEEVPPRRDRARPLASGQRVAAHVGAQVGAGRRERRQHAGLDAGDVRDDGVGVCLELLLDDEGRDVGRRGDDHEIDALGTGVGDAGTDVPRERQRGGRGVGEQHAGTGRREPEADAGAEQAGAHNADGAELERRGRVEAHARSSDGIGGTSARRTSVPRR
jgi:hypothetical protein